MANRVSVASTTPPVAASPPVTPAPAVPPLTTPPVAAPQVSPVAAVPTAADGTPEFGLSKDFMCVSENTVDCAQFKVNHKFDSTCDDPAMVSAAHKPFPPAKINFPGGVKEVSIDIGVPKGVSAAKADGYVLAVDAYHS